MKSVCHALGEPGGGPHIGRHLVVDRQGFAAVDPGQELVLAGKVLVNQELADACAVGNRLHGNGLDATAEDQLHSGVEQVFTALRPRQALRGHHSCPNAPSCALRSHVQQC
jgi:hypothetical protein